MTSHVQRNRKSSSLRHASHRFHLPRGASLIEVIVAVVVLSVGLLALAALQLNGLKAASDSGHRAQAVILAEQMIDRMRAERTAALDGAFDTDAAGGDLNAAVVAWQDRVAASLPAGEGRVQTNGDRVRVEVRWQNRFAGRAGEVDEHAVVIRSQL